MVSAVALLFFASTAARALDSCIVDYIYNVQETYDPNYFGEELREATYDVIQYKIFTDGTFAEIQRISKTGYTNNIGDTVLSSYTQNVAWMRWAEGNAVISVYYLPDWLPVLDSKFLRTTLYYKVENGGIIGKGVGGSVVIKGPDGALITDGSAAPIKFPDAAVGESTVCNFTGNIVKPVTNFSVGGLSLSGSNASEFSVQNNPEVTDATSGAFKFAIYFYPKSSGTKTAILSIVNADITKGPFIIYLTAFATGGGGSASVKLLGSAYFNSGGAVKVRNSPAQGGRYKTLGRDRYRKSEYGVEFISNLNGSSRSGPLSYELWAMPYLGAKSGVVLMTCGLDRLSAGDFYHNLVAKGQAVYLGKRKFPEQNLWEYTANGWKFRNAITFRKKANL